jgi:thymidylate synthase
LRYKPYENRAPDGQYQALLRRIVADGVEGETRQGPSAFTVLQAPMTFDLASGFPVITDRDVSSFWSKPIGELCAFINGARTVDELRAFGCDWWDAWATPDKTSKRGLPPGDLGPGSYGPANHDYPFPPDASGAASAGGGGFDQYKHLVEQIKELPYLRTHWIDPWVAPYQVRGEGKTPKTTIAPCHGWVHVRILQGRIHLHMTQRSGDVPVGVPSNMIQYAALVLMLEQLTGYEAGVFYHTISDAHIYEDQLDQVRLLLNREPRRLPTVRLTSAGSRVQDIHDFRAEHFELADYDPHPSVGRWPVAT